jgi:DNA polymerase-4
MTTAQRHIAHFDLDAFFVAVECLKNSRLKGKPLLVGGSGDRGVVAACSYEARRFGIHSAMPMKLARRLCPEAIVIRGDMESYGKYSRLVTDIMQDSVPLFEKASIDEFYVDLSGMDKFFGCRRFAGELKTKVLKESGLIVSYGLASNKLISKVATDEIKPNGQLEIAFAKEKSFLAPLPVQKLPGIGKETAYKLIRRGVETIRTLSEIPVEMLETMMGAMGVELWRKANGVDESPVIPYREQKSISTERTFETDTIGYDTYGAAACRAGADDRSGRFRSAQAGQADRLRDGEAALFQFRYGRQAEDDRLYECGPYPAADGAGPVRKAV